MRVRWAGPSVVVALLWVPTLLLVVETSRNVRVSGLDGVISARSPWALLFEDRAAQRAMWTSLVTATLVGLVTAIVALTAVFIDRSIRWGGTRYTPSAPLSLVSVMSVGMPEVVIGLGALLVLVRLGVRHPFGRLVFGEALAWTGLAIGIVAQISRHVPLDLEAAAADCGASALQTWCRVLLPLHVRGIAVAGLTAALFTFDDFLVAYFVTPPGTETFPQFVMGLITRRRFPEASAAGAVLMIVAVVCAAALYGPVNGIYARPEEDDE